jgi:MerR family transcriptional regulator/heat shock protein HspR
MASDAKNRPVYVISVAAELVDMHPQTLRLYERKGLIRPGRSSGKTRLYSERDIEHLREIRRLTQELGVNLAGVEEIMRLRHNLDGARHRMEGAIDRIQHDLSERMTKWRQLPTTGEEGGADSPRRLSLPPGLAALTELSGLTSGGDLAGEDLDDQDLDDPDDLGSPEV